MLLFLGSKLPQEIIALKIDNGGTAVSSRWGPAAAASG